MLKIKTFIDPLRKTLLISLHPPYVKQIENGTKVIEYRKSFFKHPFQAFVYTTGKHGGIELFIKCGQPIIGEAKLMARIGQKIQNDNYQETYQYFIKKNQGVIIPILKAISLKKISKNYLFSHFKNFSAPQSYLFLNRADKKNILGYLKNDECVRVEDNQWNEKYKEINEILK
ncbi:hypothetical protein WR164_10800 [Philodulcilactobacillus myokoensis]|uniref:ASCH domain-containing protein n=1 Tax=Philodulcilactobacillus myokoensis TaxID=2929573 RepID=A0A9W6B211_9LACO|nr:hypothetical protein [Philodulcilactobacillus myokoensis]GLB47101.1 hypothetical protein WR164_10800 [Philodulcilactobacillus myokoensis]